MVKIAVLFISLVLSTFGQGADAVKSREIIEEVEKASSELRDAIARRNEAALKRILADDYIFVHSTGNTDDKALRIKKIITNKLPTVESSSRDNVHYRVYSETVIVSSDARHKSELNGVVRDLQFRGIMVWVKNQARWQLVAQQSTRVQPERTAISVEAKLLDLYVGKYELSPGSIYTVTREGNALFGQRTEQRRVSLTAESETKFFVEGLNAQVQFYKNENGVFDTVGIRIGDGKEIFGKKIN